MLKKKNGALDRKGYYRWLLNSVIDILRKKNKSYLEYYNYKKYLENGKKTKN